MSVPKLSELFEFKPDEARDILQYLKVQILETHAWQVLDVFQFLAPFSQEHLRFPPRL